MSQHFHHHSDEISHNELKQFHSHLINNLKIPHSEGEEHSHNIDRSMGYHFHFIKLNNYSGLNNRTIEISPALFKVDFYPEAKSSNPIKNILENKPKNCTQLAKWVQSASNVSPPLA